MAIPKEKEEEYYTYADFLEWDEDFRAELFDGEIVMMAPPFTKHQLISGELFFQIRKYLEGKPCKILTAPYAVRLFPKKNKSDDTVFQPDIVVVCDPINNPVLKGRRIKTSPRMKLDNKGCNGPPDLVIEIVSPSTAKYDRVYKLRKYQKAGVREYWIVDPEIKSVQVFVLENGRYVASVYEEPEKVRVSILKDCELDLKAVFAEAELVSQSS
jgi:Uma2 family endonuclease